MGQQEQIVEFAKDAFMPLVDDHDFRPPTVTFDRNTTQIDFLSRDIGIEIEFDWREFDVVVFVVRLIAGRLPDGYYVSNGKKCRKYLQEVLHEKGWPVPSALAPSKENPSEARLKATISAQKDSVLSHIDDLLRLGKALF